MKTISYKNTHYVVFDINDGDKFTLSPTQASIGDDNTLEVKKQNTVEQEDKSLLDRLSSYNAANKEKLDFLCRIVKDKRVIARLIRYGLSLDSIVQMAYKGII
jgi:hypothetical protein